MSTEVKIDIDAAPEHVWAIIADVERWHEWTESITSIEILDGAPLALGSRARVRQPGFPAVTWRVTRFEAGRGFEWTAPGPGFTNVGGHWVEPLGAGSTATLSIRRSGPLAGLATRLFRSKERRYVEMEAAGLKRRAEALAASPGAEASTGSTVA